MSAATARAAQWLQYEQTLNEQIDRDASGSSRVNLCSHTVKQRYRPENGLRWPQEIIWLPGDRVRTYGPVDAEMQHAFGLVSRPGHAPMLLHPQLPAGHRRLREKFGSVALGSIQVTPTSSYRAVFAVADGRLPVVLKLSLGAVVSGVRRQLRERDIATGIVVSRLLDSIPLRERHRIGFDWFAETAGVVETQSDCGWLMRRLPRIISERNAGTVVPVFSLISRRGQDEPMLVELIERSGLCAEEYVLRHLIRPYVEVLAYLLFVEGIHVEGHTQNVLVELAANGSLTRRLVLRDLSDMSVCIPLRIANRKPLPSFATNLFPATAPFPLASVAGDHLCNPSQPCPGRARETVERFGLGGFVWSINTSMARYFPDYQASEVETGFLQMWQEQTVQYLNLRPLFRSKPRGLAIDEAIDWFLGHFDWSGLAAPELASLPKGAEPLRIEKRARRLSGRRYQHVQSHWGELYLDDGLPVFFSPAL